MLHYRHLQAGAEQLIGSQDQKLLLVKSSFLATGGPLKLIAGPPEHLTSISDIPSPSLPITSEPNSYFHLNELEGEGSTEVDFTRVEDFFQLETQIDAKKDHSVVKLTLTSPDGTFLNDLISSYALPSQRLAFIQQMNHSVLSVQQNTYAVTPGQDKELIVSCQVCGEMFSYLHKFQRHILTHSDPENKKFLCQVCGKRFNRADHLNRHSILHGEVLHKCLLCGEEFDRASHLDRHRRKNHPPAGQAPSQTPPLTPQLKFPSETSPQSGLEDTSLGTNLHLLASVATPEDSQDLTPEELLQMEANKVVSQILISDMNTEQRENNKRNLADVERPFVCEVCGRKFIRSTHLRRHIRIHTGEKPFACHICGRRYARGDYLRAHIHAHRRDRVHKCKHCSEIFHDLTRFADHCRLLHKDAEDEYGNIQEPPITPSDRQDSFMLCDDTEVSINTIESVQITDTSSPIPIVAVAMERGQSRRLDDVMSPFSTGDSLNPQFSTSELLHAFTSATSTQPDSQIILHNGNLSIPETGNEVTVLTGKVGHGAMLESLTQLFMTGSGTSIDVLGNDHSH